MSRPAPISTNLRQKLSSLTSPVAPSFSSSTATFSTSLGPAKKRGILGSWLRGKGPDHAVYPDPKGKERQWDAGELDEEMQRIMNSVIFNGGLDYETRPMVVITAAALPNPTIVDYDVLLQLILSYLDLYVEADYTVVFLAAGGKHSPGWSWIWRAYRSLSRKYRKNLKKLYIVHSTGFSKMLFSLAGAIISPKFYSKIEYITTLSDLAVHVPISQMNIHPAVYTENLRYEREIVLPATQQADARIFGVSLDELMGTDGESGGIPRPVREAITYLRTDRIDGTSPLQEQGLFRRSPSSIRLKQVQGCYDRGQVVDLAQFGDANLAAVLIKKYFRALPEPIFPESTFMTIRKCPDPDEEENREAMIEYIRERILGELEGNKQVLLNVVFQLLHEVAERSAENLMDAYNLSIVFTPNLVSNENPLKAVQMSMVASPPSTSARSKDIIAASSPTYDSSAQVTKPSALPRGAQKREGTTLGTVVRVCIEDYYEIFDEIRDITEAVPEPEMEIETAARSSTKAGSPISSTRGESSPPTSPEIITPPMKDNARVFNSVHSKFHDNFAPSNSLTATHHPHRSRGRGNAGPPPSAASASMALLAKALAEGTPKAPNESSTLLRQSQSHPSYGIRPTLDTATANPSEAYLASRANIDSPGLIAAGSVSETGGRSGSGWTGGKGFGLPKARSVISIEKTLGGEGFNGRESIKLGRGSGGTMRKSASAGVVGVGITANGFFASPSAGGDT